MAGGKVEDTGIRLTGGEYVNQPKTVIAARKKAYERIKEKSFSKKKKIQVEQINKALYEATLTFLTNPQFD